MLCLSLLGRASPRQPVLASRSLSTLAGLVEPIPRQVRWIPEQQPLPGLCSLLCQDHGSGSGAQKASTLSLELEQPGWELQDCQAQAPT